MRAGYGSVANIYDGLNALVFGKSMIQSQTAFFNQLAACQKILVVGGGTGVWLNDLLDRYPHLEITFVDASSEMIHLARKRLKANHQVNFVHSTIQSFPNGEQYDAVLLFYFLDLFQQAELPMILREIRQKLKPNSFWLVTDFVQEKKWQTFLLWIMYLFFRFTTGLKTQRLPDCDKSLKEKGLIKISEKRFYNGFIRSTLYQSA